MRTIKFISLASHGKGISGGDRIWIEFVRFWQKKTEINLVTWDQGLAMFRRQQVSEPDRLHITLINSRLFKAPFLISYITRIVKSIAWAFTTSVNKPEIIYSSSEFWMDSLPAFILKMRNKQNKWVASWYQTAPGFLKGFSDTKRGESYKFSSFLYWLAQLPIKPLIVHFADFILVNNEDERKQFPQISQNRILVVLGAVRLDQIKKWQKKNQSSKKIYEVVFQGRFHPQKGVEELIDIWGRVCKKLPNATLVMIGDGPLMKKVKQKIQQLKLEKNIVIKGYLFDGEEKYRVFAQSKIVVHPSFYDSGGMASAEAMAFGLPVVGFDLLSYKTYYPYGMVTVKKGDLAIFARTIIDLLANSKKRNLIGKEGMNYLFETSSWSKRADEILNQIT